MYTNGRFHIKGWTGGGGGGGGGGKARSSCEPNKIACFLAPLGIIISRYHFT